MKKYNKQVVLRFAQRGALLCIGVLLTVSSLIATATASGLDKKPELLQIPEVHLFIDRISKKHDFSQDELSALLVKSTLQESILKAMNNQAEAKKWFEYRPIFIQPSRIDLGVEFVREHRDLLTRVESQYGVATEVIASIIGVETRYGHFKGSHRVLDALVTLGFYYPRRATFFQGELEHFLLLSREEQMDPLTIRGSYAGAMGMPQFMPSSFREYAVDYDENGRRNLWDNAADVTASVANYFVRHGWQQGQPVAVRAKVQGDAWKEIQTAGIQRPSQPAAWFKKHGVEPQTPLSEDYPMAFLVLEGSDGPEFWLVMENFYVITRYNRSSMYAMAVFQLSEMIAQGVQAK